MKRTGFKIILAIFACFVLVFLSPILFRKRIIPLISNGKVVAVAERTFVAPWNDGQVDVYAGKTKLFSIWTDLYDGPVYIYPYSDGQRFLCDFYGDTSKLVFMVDFRSVNDIGFASSNVVFDTVGKIRFPYDPEVEEACKDLNALSPSELRARSFPFNDFGIVRFYASRDDLLKDIKTVRQPIW